MSSKTTAHIRYKTADGAIVPGVTTVLGVLAKPALVPWANKLGLQGIDVRKYVDDKADIGTLGHAFVTDKLIGKETDTADFSANQIAAAENCAASFWEWEAKNHVESVHFVETPLISEMNRFGGTQDIFCRIDGKNTLIDLKTGKGIWPEHVYQVAALRELLLENGYDVDEVRVLNIPRAWDESFAEKICTPKQLETGWKIFLDCLDIYYRKKEEKGEQ